MNYFAIPGMFGTVGSDKIVNQPVGRPRKKVLTPKEILDTVCEVLEVEPRQARSRTRKREFVVARQYYAYFSRELTNRSLTAIGAYVGNDHATMLHSIRSINNLIETDKRERKRRDDIRYALILNKDID